MTKVVLHAGHCLYELDELMPHILKRNGALASLKAILRIWTDNSGNDHEVAVGPRKAHFSLVAVVRVSSGRDPGKSLCWRQASRQHAWESRRHFCAAPVCDFIAFPLILSA